CSAIECGASCSRAHCVVVADDADEGRRGSEVEVEVPLEARSAPRAAYGARVERGNPDHPAVHGAGLVGLAVGAIGVVFGDIGTSPLYAMQTVFAIDGGAVKPTRTDVYGVVSLVFWSITLIVSVKYVTVMLRADNDGEGGVMALAALIREKLPSQGRWVTIAMALGVVGASLFY